MGTMNTAIAWQESAIRSERVRAAVERNTRAGKRTGGGSKPFGYKIIRHHQGEGARRRWRIVGEELEPAEAKLIKDAATRVLRGESLRSIAMDRNKRGIKTVGASSTKPKDERTDQDRDARVWPGSMIRRVLVSPRIAGLREHHGEVITKDGEPVKAAWPEIINRETHHRLVGLLKDPSRRPANLGRPRVHPPRWLALLRIMRWSAGQLSPAETVSTLRMPERREPKLRGPSANRRRASGGLHRGLRDRPVAEPSGEDDRAVR
jgi:site-specific DNA recombinase